MLYHKLEKNKMSKNCYFNCLNQEIFIKLDFRALSVITLCDWMKLVQFNWNHGIVAEVFSKF